MSYEIVIGIISMFLSVSAIIFTAGVLKQKVAVCERDILRLERDQERQDHEHSQLRREQANGIAELREHLDTKLNDLRDRVDRIRDRGNRHHGELEQQ